MNEGYCPTCGQLYPADLDTFGGRVQAARVAAGTTRTELAEQIGYVRQTVVTKWETGRAPMPDSIELVEKLAAALNVTPEYLIFGSSNNETATSGGSEHTTHKED